MVDRILNLKKLSLPKINNELRACVAPSRTLQAMPHFLLNASALKKQKQ